MILKPLLYAFILYFHYNIGVQDSLKTDSLQVDSLKIYQIEKIKQEVAQLKSENSVSPIYRIIPSYVGILTAIGALFGAYFSYRKYLQERRNELDQRKRESKIRLEDQFNAIIENLGSEIDSVKASATVSLLTFLTPEYKQFHQQAYLILLSSLKTEHSRNVNTLMVKTFEKALRMNLESIQSQRSDKAEENENIIELDLSRTHLYRIDLHGLNLENVDFAFADLKYANLTECNLKRARGIEADLTGARLSRADMTEARFNKANFENAQLHGTRLVSATLRQANLKDAEFQQAEMQEAHLDESVLDGARFEQANMNNSFFRNMPIQDKELKSMLRSDKGSWQKANFDPEVQERIKFLSQ